MAHSGNACLMLAALLTTSSLALAQGDRHVWNVRIDLDSALPSTDVPSWLHGSAGKLRYDERHDGLGVGRVLVDYDGRLKPTWFTRITGDYVDDGDRGFDLTEAFVEWRPVPKSPNRQRLKLGAFFPELSLENRDRGWTSPYSISPSAINTWIGEEVRTLGAEWSLTRSLGAVRPSQEIKLIAAAFLGNDPAGTLLAWKGWSVHDRQTRLNEILPLPPLPQIGPGALFERQAVQAEPFIETDDRPGYYVGAEWRPNRRTLVAAMHYDNHADPLSVRRGQYGWTTRFDHFGAQLELPADLGLIVQWLEGTTVMGPIVGSARVVDTAFRSYFVLLTRRVHKHRVSLRFDEFSVTDRDETPLDANGESGHAWMLGYTLDHSARLAVKAELLGIETSRPAWAYLGLPTRATERILQTQLTLRFGGQR
jgi:hypothetical protein